MDSSSSSPLQKICKIKEGLKKDTILFKKGSSMYNYHIGLDHNRFVAFVSAEIHEDSLDRGENVHDNGLYIAKRDGVFPGDVPRQLVSAKLGGWSQYCNYLPVNSKLDLTPWTNAENTAYEHVKLGGNRTALIMIGAVYERPKISRPVRFYHVVKLMENGEQIGETIENEFQNERPKVKFDRPSFVIGEL